MCILQVHTVDIQDRDGAQELIAYAIDNFPKLSVIFADGGYCGDKLKEAVAALDGPVIEMVKRPSGAKGFIVVKRRWVVERTFAWLGRCRRFAKDWETSIASSEAWTTLASIRRMVR